MNAKGLYIIASIVILLIITVLVFAKGNKRNRLTPTAGLAFSFTLAGIIFGDSRFLGYSLIGIGIVLALIDIFIRSKTKKK